MPRKPSPVVHKQRSTLERSIDDYLADVKSRRRGVKTLHYYEAVLIKQFLPFCLKAGVTDLSSIDQKLINRWTTWLGDRAALASPNAKARTGKLSVSTVDSYERTVNQFLRWARVVAREITAEVKAQRPNIPHISRKVLEGPDVELMEGAARTERDKLIIRVLWETGLRASELTGLTTDDLIEGSGRSYFLHVKGKAGHEREVPIAPALYRRLRRFAEKRSVEERDRPELWLGVRRATTGEYEPLEPSGLGQMLASVAHQAGVKKPVNPHAWRHSFATQQVRAGMNLVILQQILGHRSLAMLSQHYAHPTPSDLTKAMMAALKGKA